MPRFITAEDVQRMLDEMNGDSVHYSGPIIPIERMFEKGAHATREEPRYRELIRVLRDDWDIDASWDGLRGFWDIGLTDEGVRKRDERDARGVGECLNVGAYWKFKCSECGATLRNYDSNNEPSLTRDGGAMLPKYCPSCGRRIILVPS